MVEEEAAANMIRGVARIGKGEGEGEIVAVGLRRLRLTSSRLFLVTAVRCRSCFGFQSGGVEDHMSGDFYTCGRHVNL